MKDKKVDNKIISIKQNIFPTREVEKKVVSKQVEDLIYSKKEKDNFLLKFLGAK